MQRTPSRVMFEDTVPRVPVRLPRVMALASTVPPSPMERRPFEPPVPAVLLRSPIMMVLASSTPRPRLRVPVAVASP